jgi:3D (Asp-Asp-Asp) domain-containing protein
MIPRNATIAIIAIGTAAVVYFGWRTDHVQSQSPSNQSSLAAVRHVSHAETGAGRQGATGSDRHSARGNQGRTVRFTVTAYCNDFASCGKRPGQRGYGITASGQRARYGLVAADWRVLPRGTRLQIPGYGAATVADKGGAIKGNRLDLWFPTHRQAKAWGIRYLSVTIKEN